ncbi:unnamed protein product [Amoebophrya sp. A25]|nr:unnamed protein product [Amoebophrya sp. A25]|eukprot:GSA25T00012991001.1
MDPHYDRTAAVQIFHLHAYIDTSKEKTSMPSYSMPYPDLICNCRSIVKPLCIASWPDRDP